MLDFILNLTYGDIRAILNEYYKKGLKRSLLGSQSGIRALENQLNGCDESATVSAEDFLTYVTLANNIVQTSLKNPKNIAAKKAGTYRAKAHNRCSEALLALFSEKFREHCTRDDYLALRQAIVNYHIHYLQWCVDVQSLLEEYHLQHDEPIPYNDPLSGLTQISPYLFSIHSEVAHVIEEQGQDCIYRLVTRPDKKLYDAVNRLSMDLMAQILTSRHELAAIIDNTLTQLFPIMHELLDWLFMRTSVANGKLKPDSFFCDYLFRQAIQTNNRHALNWFTRRSAVIPDNLHTQWLTHQATNHHDDITRIQECDAKTLQVYTDTIRPHLTSEYRDLYFSPPNDVNAFCAYLFSAAIKRQDTPVLRAAFDLVKSRVALETTDTLFLAFIKTFNEDPSLFSSEYSVPLLTFFGEMQLTNKILEAAFASKNSQLFVWLATYESRFFDLYKRFDGASFNALLTLIALGDDPRLLEKLANIPAFQQEIRLLDLFKRLVTPEVAEYVRTPALKRMLAINPDIIAAFMADYAQGDKPRLHTETTIHLIESTSMSEEAVLKTQFPHAAFASMNVSGMQWFAKRYPAHLAAFIAHDHYRAFLLAANQPTITELTWLTNNSSPSTQAEALNTHGRAMALAALRHCSINYLVGMKNTNPKLFPLLVKAECLAFVLAANETDDVKLRIIRWLFENLNEHLGDILNESDRWSIHKLIEMAIKVHDLPTLQLISRHTPALISEHISRNDFAILHDALSALSVLPYQHQNKYSHQNKTQINFIEWLLEDPNSFSWAERRTEMVNSTHPNHPWRALIHQYTHAFIGNLHWRVNEYDAKLQDNPFDLNRHEAERAFHMVRALIRNGQDIGGQNLSDIRFLLSIPSVRALAHQAIGQASQENELLRLAVRHNNDAAASALLDIPAVMALAEANNFYQQQANPEQGLNLRQLAQNTESSTANLTEEEKKAYQRVIDHYTPLINRFGVQHYIKQLREAIIKEYETNPATIKTITGRTLKLPTTYDAFSALRLNTIEHERALKAYYAHQIHGAFRLLSRPNPWIHPYASYVVGDHRGRWASESYDNLIAIFYLAAIDEKIPCINGFTPQTRWIHFLHELALINRGHNWDKKNAAGHEYDDMEGDRPSCGPGMKNRTQQSTPGSALLDTLTQAIVLEYIREFAFSHFVEVLTKQDPSAILAVYDEAIIDGNIDRITDLAVFNIPKVASDGLKLALKHIYGAQFTVVFQKLFDSKFNLDTASRDVLNHYHILTLEGLCNFYPRLEASSKKAAEPKVSQIGLYANNDNTKAAAEHTPKQTLRK